MKNLEVSKLIGDEPEELEIIKCKKDNLFNFVNEQKNLDSRAISCIYLLEKIIT